MKCKVIVLNSVKLDKTTGSVFGDWYLVATDEFRVRLFEC